MNVSLVAGFVMNFLMVFVKRRKAILLAFIVVWIYAFMSGLEAPIARAAIMASISLIAQELGRVVSPWRCLCLSAMIMLIIRPNWISDLGFLLSFVATTSLVLFQGRIEKKLRLIPVFFRESLSTTLAAQIGVTPILFATFGSFNILSPLINVLVLWTVPLIMIIGALAGLTGVIFPFLGKLILYTIYPLTSWFIGIIRLFG
jgi:competence protein ComEC